MEKKLPLKSKALLAAQTSMNFIQHWDSLLITVLL
jgi:hypothetical protein